MDMEASELGDQQLQALLRRVAQRDKAAFRTLYHSLYPKLSRYLLRIVRRVEDAEDLINEVMWVVWEKAGEFRGEAQVATWVLGIATFKSYRWQKQRRHQQMILAHQRIWPEEDTANPDSDELIDHGMAQLSEEHRETIELRYFYGYSCEEIATIMTCPLGTVKTRLHYARKRLRQILETHFSMLGDTP